MVSSLLSLLSPLLREVAVTVIVMRMIALLSWTLKGRQCGTDRQTQEFGERWALGEGGGSRCDGAEMER